MIIADSDVLIDALRGREPGRARIEAELRTGQLGTTVITVFELLSGVRGQRELIQIEKLLGALQVWPLDAHAARQAGDLRRDLERQGQGLATAPCLIAGICLAQGATLLTRNRKHFERVPGLVLGRLELP